MFEPGRPGRGPVFRKAWSFIEPMIAKGDAMSRSRRQWTVAMRDHEPSAHYENTIVVTADGPQILTQG